MANANIFQQYLQPPKSVIDYSNDYAKADALKNANALQSLQLGQATNVMQQRNALQALVQSGQTDLTTPQGQAQAIAVAPDVAPAMVKSVQDGITGAAAAQKDIGAGVASQATAASTTQKTSQTNYTDAMQKVLSFKSPDDATASLNAAVGAGRIDMAHAALLLKSMPTDPAGFDQWKRQWAVGITDPDKMAALLAPHINTINTGGSQVTQAIDPITLQPTTISSMPTTVSPDTIANNATSRANTAAGIVKDYKVAGLDGGGNMPAFAAPATAGVPAPGGAPGASPAPGNAPGAPAQPTNPLQGLVDSIGQYKVGEGVALQRVPAAQKAAVLAQVQAQYPSYSPADFGSINKTIGSMSSGPMGNMVRSINVVQTHLDTLNQLTQAMSNGDIPLVNKLRNIYQTQTGQTAPTNLDAAKQLVMGEVANVVAAGASTQGDRQTAEAALNSAASPAQFSGVINNVIKPMMAGKLQGIEQQYQAGTMGRTDFRTRYLSPAARASLEAVSPTPAGATATTAPAGWSYLGTTPGATQ